MMSPADSPLAVDNETGLNGVILHWHGFVGLMSCYIKGDGKWLLWENIKKKTYFDLSVVGIWHVAGTNHSNLDAEYKVLC